MSDHEENLEEESTMASGAVHGNAAPLKDDDETEENNENYIKRKDFLEELQLRAIVKECISEIKKEKNNSLNEDEELRLVIRKLISEVKKDVEDAPNESTAINLLEELLKQILPILETNYKTLTSNLDQRQSFRAHIVNAVDSALKTEDVNREGGEEERAEEDLLNLDNQEELEEVEIKVADTDLDPLSDEDKFIDIEEPQPEEEKDDFGIEGQDETGKAMAKKTFDNIEKNIVETYDILNDLKDQEIFKEYLITNLKLYFDKFEKELGNVTEPTTDEYEQEIASDTSL
jgi:hypothetical protein